MLKSNGKEKARAGNSGGADIRAGYLTAPIVVEKPETVNSTPRAMMEARLRALELARRGEFAESAYWLDRVYYPWLRIRTRNGGAR